jgi:hypothetical protein
VRQWEGRKLPGEVHRQQAVEKKRLVVDEQQDEEEEKKKRLPAGLPREKLSGRRKGAVALRK